jgi:hypothetical protein
MEANFSPILISTLLGRIAETDKALCISNGGVKRDSVIASRFGRFSKGKPLISVGLEVDVPECTECIV